MENDKTNGWVVVADSGDLWPVSQEDEVGTMPQNGKSLMGHSFSSHGILRHRVDLFYLV